MLRFHLPEEKKLVHQMVLPIRWGDMDMMGHVSNAVYFRYFETSRISWLHGLGAAPNPQGEGPVIVNAFCSFLRQLEFPGDLLLKHYVAHVGRTSFDTYITMERTDEPGVIVAEGGAKAVWTDGVARKSAPLPEWLRAVIS
jgi:acyl-CoA thioester hydrolase